MTALADDPQFVGDRCRNGIEGRAHVRVVLGVGKEQFQLSHGDGTLGPVGGANHEVVGHRVQTSLVVPVVVSRIFGEVEGSGTLLNVGHCIGYFGILQGWLPNKTIHYF